MAGVRGFGPSRNQTTLILAVQLAVLGGLIYWTFILLRPFLAMIVWSIILAVLLDPLFRWSISRFRLSRFVAAILVTALCLVVLAGPVAWLGLSLIGSARSLAERLATGDVHVPPPIPGIRQWPFVGEPIYSFWSLASTDLEAALAQLVPQIRPYRGSLLEFAGSAGVNMLKFIFAVVIAGVLLVSAPTLVTSVRTTFRHMAGERGDEFVDLIGATIRNLARGLIGVSIAQALLAGIGLMLAGVPAPGVISLLILVLGILQIDAAVVVIPILIWAWLNFETTTAALLTIYMVPVALMNNILRPFVMAHGLDTPMLVIFIGVVGGILAHGVIGLFVGPIVLAISWDLLVAWARMPVGEPRTTIDDARSADASMHAQL